MDIVTEYHLFGADLELILDELYSCRLWEILNCRHEKERMSHMYQIADIDIEILPCEINIQNLMCSSVPIITNT
jgi:hypothetical protein